MKYFLVKLIKKYPKLLSLFSWFYSLNSFFLIKGRISNTINYKASFLKNTRIDIKGQNNLVDIAIENRLRNCLIHISGNNCVVKIDKHCILSNLEIWLEDDFSQISIGENITFEGGHIASTEGKKITIGNDCMFSDRIEIRNGDSHAIFDIESNNRINNARDVSIGNHVWLGSDVKVMKGSVIADNTIIGTGSIVSGLLEPSSIYVGTPAKKIKTSIYWTRER